MRWLRWLLDNPQLVLLLAGAIAYWLTQSRQRKNIEQEAEEELEREPEQEEMEERTRRIQEEIRRRIAERRGGAVPPPVPAEPQRLEEWQEPVAPPLPPVVSVETAPGAEAVERALDEQRRYAEALEQLEQANRSRAVSMAPVLPVAQFDAPAAAVRPAGARLPLLAELRDPQALRRAFVLREILGPAKGLQ